MISAKKLHCNRKNMIEDKTPDMENVESYVRTSDSTSNWYIRSTPTKGQSKNDSGETQDSTNTVGERINVIRDIILRPALFSPFPTLPYYEQVCQYKSFLCIITST